MARNSFMKYQYVKSRIYESGPGERENDGTA